MLLSPIKAAAKEHRLLSAGQQGAVAFSGGPDSLCLLHLLARLAREPGAGFGLEALVVDHGLRQSSAEEAAQASAMASELGVPAVTLLASIQGKGNLQQQAREARLTLLQARAEASGLDWVALGHTADDQAETLLMRAVRGTGLQGLAGMGWRRGAFIRPLLGITRPQVEQYLDQHKLIPLQDPTNASDLFFRNRIRHRVLPLLEQENPGVVPCLCRLADTCREARESLAILVQQALDRSRKEEGGFDARILGSLPPGLKHEALRLAHAEAVGSCRGLQRDHVLKMAALLEACAGTHHLDIPSGVRLENTYGVLRWRQGREEAHGEAMQPLEVPGPGAYQLSNGRTILFQRRSWEDGDGARDLRWGGAGEGVVHLLDASKVRFPLQIRGRLPGDRLSIGPGRSRKVSRMLIDAKLPMKERSEVPLVFFGDQLVLLVGQRRAFGYAPKEGAEVLLVRY